MNALERLAAAAAGRPVDRIPVFCNLLDQGARELGLPLRDYYASGERVAEGQLRLRERYGYDNLWALFYVGKEAELLGDTGITFASDGPPNVSRFCLRTPEDILRLEVPRDLASHPAMVEPLRCLRLLRREAGGKYPICTYLTASMTLPAILMGMEAWLGLLLGGPAELRDALLTKCSEFFRAQAALFRAEGADILLYSNPFGSADFLPLQQVHDVALPWMERDLAPGGPAGVVYYCGSARMNPVIGEVQRRTGVNAWYLGPEDDIAEGQRLAGPDALCAGVINDIKLIDWSPERIREEVRRMLAAGMPGGRFMFGTVLMPLAIPEANIRAMLEAAFELGQVGGA